MEDIEEQGVAAEVFQDGDAEGFKEFAAEGFKAVLLEVGHEAAASEKEEEEGQDGVIVG